MHITKKTWVLYFSAYLLWLGLRTSLFLKISYQLAHVCKYFVPQFIPHATNDYGMNGEAKILPSQTFSRLIFQKLC